MRHLHGGAEIAVEGLDPSKLERFGQRRELRFRKALRDECEEGGRFRQNAMAGDQRRYPAFRRSGIRYPCSES